MNKITILIAALSFVGTLSVAAADQPGTRCYEMRTYYAAPGKLDELNARSATTPANSSKNTG